jgi:hypothetical protein
MPGETGVHDDEARVATPPDVAGREIAMDHIQFMAGGQTGGQITEHLQRLSW